MHRLSLKMTRPCCSRPRECTLWFHSYWASRIHKERLYVTVFKGDKDAPKDEESAKVWEELGIPKERIFYLPKKDNWWELDAGPCGPDTEIFYDTGKESGGI